MYLIDTSANRTLECTGQGSAVVQWAGGGVVDVHCRAGVHGDTVQLDSDDDSAIVCSLHVDGGGYQENHSREVAFEFGLDEGKRLLSHF